MTDRRAESALAGTESIFLLSDADLVFSSSLPRVRDSLGYGGLEEWWKRFKGLSTLGYLTFEDDSNRGCHRLDYRVMEVT